MDICSKLKLSNYAAPAAEAIDMPATPYKAILLLNRRMAQGLYPAGAEREALVQLLLSARQKGPVPSPSSGRQLWPQLFLLPEGRRLKTVLGQATKTGLLSANMYELELLRLLVLLAPELPEVEEMRRFTLERLRHTCFGWEDDGDGECFDASLIVLRFLLAAAPLPEGEGWIHSRIENYKRHRDDRSRTWHSRWYFWLCVSEMPPKLQRSEAYSIRQDIEPMLFTGPADCGRDKTLRPMLMAILERIAMTWGYSPSAGGAKG